MCALRAFYNWAAVLLVAYGTVVAAETPPEALRYQGQPKATYAYEVTIKADKSDEIETLQGTISFTVESTGAERLQLTYQGGLPRKTERKTTGTPRGLGPPFGFGPPLRPLGPPGFGRSGIGPFSSDPYTGTRPGTNRLVLTPLGSAVSLEGDSQLPFLLGNASLLIFEPLPENPQASWEVDSGVAIREGGDHPPGPPFFSPFHRNRPGRTTAGSAWAGYQIESIEGPFVQVKKSYRLHSPAADADDWEANIDGTGTWTFNRNLGMPESLDFQHQLVVRQRNTTVTIPVSIKYRRLSAEEWGKLQAEAKQRQEQLQKQLAESKAKAEAPLETAEKQQALAQLSSDNIAQLLSTLRQLQQKSPKEPDREIIAALEPLLAHSNRTVKDAAEKALAKWSPEFRQKAEVNRAYDGPGFVKEPGRPLGPDTPLFPGQIVAARDTGAWYPAEVLDAPPGGEVEVQFRRGLRSQKKLPRANLQLAPPAVEQPNLTPEQVAAIENPAPEPSAATSDALRGLRTWTDDTGQFAIEAVFVGFADDKIRLRRQDGREVSVPIERLSTADREAAEKLRQQASATNPFEP